MKKLAFFFVCVLLCAAIASCGSDASPPATDPITEPTAEPTAFPATEPPVTDPPVTEPPATEPPATEPPATEPPVTDPPATEPPATEPPAPAAVDTVLDLGGSYEKHPKNAVYTFRTEGLNTVKKEIFGDNLAWRGNGYGIYDPAKKSFNEKLVEAIKNSGVTNIRYPGGIEGDFFIWHETVGSSRKAQVDPFSDAYPTNATKSGVKYYPHFGFDEFFELCRLAEVEPVVQLNAGTGTAKEAADLIKYCLDKGINVSSYAIGNEVHFKSEPVEGIKHTKTAEEYITFSNEVYAELGDLASRVELGVIGIPPSHPLCRDSAWDKKILTALGDKIDFIDVHIGYAPLYTLEGDKDEDIFKAYMAAPEYIKTLLKQVKNEIKRYGGDNAENITIQITEYGPMGTHYWGTIGSTFLASLFQLMIEEPMISSANHLPLLNHPYAPNVVGYMKTSAGEVYWDNLCTYIFRWYSAQIGRTVLAYDSEMGTFRSSKIGIVPAQLRAPTANCATYVDENGNGTLFLINQCTTENLEFNISLPYERIVITGITELFNEDFTVANTVKTPNLIKPKEYACDSTVRSGKLTVTAKPVSVVKIDFEVVK